jgi:acetyltransferase
MNRLQAQEMVEEIRSYKLLAGVRGQPPADIDAIVDTLLRVSQMVNDWPEIAEMDINPLLVREQGKGAVAVDMRLVLTPRLRVGRIPRICAWSVRKSAHRLLQGA